MERCECHECTQARWKLSLHGLGGFAGVGIGQIEHVEAGVGTFESQARPAEAPQPFGPGNPPVNA